MPFLKNTWVPRKIFFAFFLYLISWLPSLDKPICWVSISQDTSQSLLLIIIQVWQEIEVAEYWHFLENKVCKNQFAYYVTFVKWEWFSRYLFFCPEEAGVNPVPAANFYQVVRFHAEGQNPVSFTFLKFTTKHNEGSAAVEKKERKRKTE